MTDDARILIVDDDEGNRYTLSRRLAREGYTNVAEAENGRAALVALDCEPFDLVLLDIMMPEIDGHEVLKRMREDPRLRHVPVLMISAASDSDNVVRCIANGADDFLSKPFDPVLLRARVGACLERKRLHDAQAAQLAAVERERRRADRLLHAILPAEAVAELRERDCVLPRRHERVAVLFADIVGFTSYCEMHPPEEAVSNLQRLSEDFEDLCAVHGLEKVKTVGDGMLAVANLLAPHPDPVLAAVRLGIDLAAASLRNPAAWRIHAGVDFGPVVAGVVGRTKFSFDLWGDTVNTAARLAGFGNAGIHVTESAWREMRGRIQGRSLGPVALKGKRTLEVFRLEPGTGPGSI
ncbi:MAG: response regulator [Rhodospirillales bacterium]|nr:response regulator [Rhodospirillales bacterium]